MTVTIPYLPREAFRAFHERVQRWAVLVVHRRAGKTVAAINDLVRAAARCDRPSPRFAYVAPTYSQAKDVAWDYLKRFTAPIPGCSISESELHVTLPGDRRVRLYGADNYDRLRGIYLDGCVVDEPADMDPEAWTSIIRPALSDRLGWCVWIGTPKGRDAFYRVWKAACEAPDYFTLRLPASESGLLPIEELIAAKRDMAKSPGAYDREYECSFETPIAGSVYGPIITELRAKGRVLDFEWERGCPVFSSWDIGWSDSTAVWLWQRVGRDYLWIWHTRQQGRTAAQMADMLRATGIPIAAHYLPHDAASTTAAVGTNYRDELKKAGLMNLIVVPRASAGVGAGLDYLRNILAQSSFHRTNCNAGLEALEAYHWKEIGDKLTVSREPVHDWASHDADAARIMAEAHILNMVTPAVAKRFEHENPRFPDGSVVDPDEFHRQRNKHRPATALSGHRPMR